MKAAVYWVLPLAQVACVSEPLDSPPLSVGSAGESGLGGEAAGTSGVPLTPEEGWLDGSSNLLGIQGALFAVADRVSSADLSVDFSGTNACIQGKTAVVDLQCQPAEGGDCYSLYFGAFLGLNLNQPFADGEVGAPQPFDATSVTGFAFDLEGPVVPRNLRFGLEADDAQFYCQSLVFEADAEAEQADRHVEATMERLVTRCHASRSQESVSSVRDKVVRLRWHITSNTLDEVPYDFCVRNLRVLTE